MGGGGGMPTRDLRIRFAALIVFAADLNIWGGGVGDNRPAGVDRKALNSSSEMRPSWGEGGGTLVS